jgi:hypothetical protein
MSWLNLFVRREGKGGDDRRPGSGHLFVVSASHAFMVAISASWALTILSAISQARGGGVFVSEVIPFDEAVAVCQGIARRTTGASSPMDEERNAEPQALCAQASAQPTIGEANSGWQQSTDIALET